MKDKKLQERLTLLSALSARQREALAGHLAAIDKALKAIGVIKHRQQRTPYLPALWQDPYRAKRPCKQLAALSVL